MRVVIDLKHSVNQDIIVPKELQEPLNSLVLQALISLCMVFQVLQVA